MSMKDKSFSSELKTNLNHVKKKDRDKKKPLRGKCSRKENEDLVPAVAKTTSLTLFYMSCRRYVITRGGGHKVPTISSTYITWLI